MNSLQYEIRRAWADSAPLTATTFIMLAALVVFTAGIVIDDRTITGVPAWLKPAKFAISTAIFSATMAWLFRYVTVWPRFLRATGWVISLVFVIEVVIIAMQAARGTTSHFNVATPFDRAMFTIMGTAIGILWLTTGGILIALFRQKFENPEWGRWLRMGMLVSVLGSGMGGMMLRPTPAQLETIRSSKAPTAVGAHTIGAPDGGPGLPGVGWSVRHGDLRIPHFMGLHGVQLLPLMGWWLMRRRARQSRTAYTAAASYVALIAILTWQALRGQSILEPDNTTLLALAGWLVATVTIMVPSFSVRAHVLAASRQS